MTPKRDTAVAETKPVPYVEGLKASRVVDVDIDDVSDDSRFQYRLVLPATDLTASIQKEGQREPIDVVGSKPPYVVVDGFRRVTALKELKWKTVKVLIHKGMRDEEAQRLAFIKNVVRKNLSPLDRANAIRQAKKRGRTHVQLAEDFGISEKQLGRYLELLDMSRELQSAIDRNTITMAHARWLSVFDVKEPAKWIARIVAEKLTAPELKKALRRALGKRPAGRVVRYVQINPKDLYVYRVHASPKTPRPELEKLAKSLVDASLKIHVWLDRMKDDPLGLKVDD